MSQSTLSPLFKNDLQQVWENAGKVFENEGGENEDKKQNQNVRARHGEMSLFSRLKFAEP